MVLHDMLTGEDCSISTPRVPLLRKNKRTCSVRAEGTFLPTKSALIGSSRCPSVDHNSNDRSLVGHSP
jgi:hypothetical protein